MWQKFEQCHPSETIFYSYPPPPILGCVKTNTFAAVELRQQDDSSTAAVLRLKLLLASLAVFAYIKPIAWLDLIV